MFGTVSIIKACSFASYHRTTEYCPVWPKNILVKKQHSWKTGLLLFDMCTLPLGHKQPSLHLDNSHLKTCFQYYPTIMYLFNQIYNSYQGDVAQIQQQILQGRLYSFKRVLHAYSIPYVQTMFDCLRIYIKVHSTFFKLQYVSRGELPTPKGVILKIWFVVLQKYHIMHSEK